MATAPLGTVIRQIRLLAGGRRAGQWTDRQLLDDFVDRRDETAFNLLVTRHGPMVLRVCRRVLNHEQDSEDAFQATFLVLARFAGAIRRRETVSSWLHGVAYRTAMSAKRSAARRRIHEARMREQPRHCPANSTWHDLQAVVDEEILRLPQSFREAFVLCVLNGRSVSAAAVELGIKEGTVASRLARSRQRLQRQLASRGIQLAALMATASFAEAASNLTVYSAEIASGNGASSARAAAPRVVALAEEAIRGMLVTKGRIATVLLLAVGLFAASAAEVTIRLQADAETSLSKGGPLAEGEGLTGAPSKSIVGVVRDSVSGKPISQVIVSALPPAGVPANGRADLQAVTDQCGHYVLTGLQQRENYVIFASPPPSQPYLTASCGRHDTPGREPITADFNLQRGVWITGRVIDRGTGMPVRARIEYAPFAGNPFGAEVLTLAAGSVSCESRPQDGSFRVVGLRGRGLVCARATEGGYRLGVGANKISGSGENGKFQTCPPINAGDFHTLVEVNLPEKGELPASEIVLEPGS